MSGKSIYIFLLSIGLLVSGCNQNNQSEGGEKSSSFMGQSSGGDAEGATSASQRSRQNGSTVANDSLVRQSRKNAITQAVQRVSPAVVSITVTEVVQGRRRVIDEYFRRFYIPTEREFSSIGSGFIISKDGLVVTNEHVAAAGAKKIMISLPEGSEGSQYEAEVIGTDELADLALLKIKADREFPFIDFGNSDEVIVGEWSLAVGNPFGLFKASQPSVTVGVVSALHRDFRPNPNKPRVYLDMIQTDAAINSGNSGGPLVNSEGRVIGVNTFIFTGGTSGGFVGLGFAIPSNRVKKIIKQLASSGEVKMGYDLGLETTPMTYQLVAENNLPAIMGLFVTSVNRDGPAFESGIVPGDIIIKIGDERVQSQMHAQALFREYTAGDSLRVELLRDNERYETKVKLRSKVMGN
jgi:serine protease Do